MSQTVNIGEAKARLSQLIARAEAGEEVILTRNGVPVARIVPVTKPIAETIELLRRERARRPMASVREIREARDTGRAR